MLLLTTNDSLVNLLSFSKGSPTYDIFIQPFSLHANINYSDELTLPFLIPLTFFMHLNTSEFNLHLLFPTVTPNMLSVIPTALTNTNE